MLLHQLVLKLESVNYEPRISHRFKANYYVKRVVACAALQFLVRVKTKLRQLF